MNKQLPPVVFFFFMLSFPMVFLPLYSEAQPTTDANRKTATALRIENAPKLDGELDDACWQNASVFGDFITNSPTFGQPSQEKTELRIVYTDEAIYVGAYMHMKDVSKIRTDLNKRDGQSTADQLHIGLDTYHDRINAFRFEVTAAGVQRDGRMSPDNLDLGWDAVWDVKVKIHTDGWVVEMRIPFSAIRFPKKTEQLWGLQVARQVQYINEFSTWSPVDPNGGGALPQWGNLSGLSNINPPLRLAFSPYLAASLQHSPVTESPVTYANSQSLSGGMDVKWGINESFTLDATLIPNFGEVQSDNIVRNLSPFEVQYEERRQFFTEGTELFNRGDVFYSRRIGGRPKGYFDARFDLGPDEVILENPSQQSLYNATKLSGKTKHKLGIGILNAVAAPTDAVIRNEQTNTTRDYQTAPLTNYNVLVLDQSLRNNSSVAFTNLSTLRQGSARDANLSALNWNIRDRSNTYEFAGVGRWTHTLDTSGASDGSWYGLTLKKVSGPWTWQLTHAAADRQYDQRDMGIDIRTNFFRQFGKISRGNYKPRGIYQYTYWEFAAENTYLNQPRKWESLELTAYAETTTKGQVQFGSFFVSRPIWFYDYFEPRIWGKKYYHAPYAFMSPFVMTDLRKKLYCRFNLDYGESPIPRDPYIGATVSPTWVANDHLRLNAELKVSKDHSNYGAVNWWDDPNDVVFGRRDITSFDNSLSAEYLFGPRMNVSIRARHYWAQLYYHEYLHLTDEGTFLPYPEYQGTADENFNQFNVDFVYTWQFAPGSFLNLIWKDAIFSGDGNRNDHFVQNFRKTVHTPQDNTLTLKLIYWLDAGRWGKS